MLKTELEKYVQKPINDEDDNLPLDVDPLHDNVDHWVRISTNPRRLVNRYDPSIHYIMYYQMRVNLSLIKRQNYASTRRSGIWLTCPKVGRSFQTSGYIKSKQFIANPSI